MDNTTTNEDVSVIGCIYRDMRPSVPSTEVRCHDCGDELWCSDDMLTEQPEALHYCIPCLARLMKAQGDTEALVHESTRQLMRDRGLSDDEIDEVARQGNLILNRIAEIQDSNFGAGTD